MRRSNYSMSDENINFEADPHLSLFIPTVFSRIVTSYWICMNDH